jgi:hypothetical protein
MNKRDHLPPATNLPKALLDGEIKQILFTTSSDISDGLILALDMKSKDITITEYLTGDRQTETLEIRVDDLFDPDSLPVDSLMASCLKFHHGNFKRLFQQTLGFINRTKVKIADFTLAVEVQVFHVADVYGMSGDMRTLTHCEFAHLLCNFLNVAQFKIFRESLLIRESRNDPDRDEESGKELIVNTPTDIFTVIRLNGDGLRDVSTFSSRAIALDKVQEHIDEICRGYTKAKIPISQRTFDQEECCWQTRDGLNHVFLYETELMDG